MQLDKGVQVHLQAVPDAGYTFTAWGGACSGTAGCDLTLAANAAVTANFAPNGPPPPPPSHLLKVTIEGSGRVTSSPAAIDCTAGTCSATFTEGTAVALTATPGTGSGFTGWGSGCSGPGACAVLMSADLHVYAHFDPLPPPPPSQFKLSVTVTGPGAVTGGGVACGNGGNACEVIVPAGTHVSLAAGPAAQARFSGWTGACTGAAGCEITVTADTAVHASFEALLQTLVPNDNTAIFVLGLNSTSVFYCRLMLGEYSIWSVPKAGGTPMRIATGAANTIVADDAFVYWTDGSAIFSAPVGGGTASQLISNVVVGKLALDTDGSLFWIEVAGSFHPGAVHRMQNRLDRVIVANNSANSGVAVDDTFVYYTVSSPGPVDGYVMRARKDGTGTVAVVGYASHLPTLVRVDSQQVYFRTWSGEVYDVPKAGGTTLWLSSANTTSGDVGTVDLDVNASIAYWNGMDTTATPRGIFKANADGTGYAAVDKGDGQWFGPRVDDTAIFYWHAGALMKRLK